MCEIFIQKNCYYILQRGDNAGQPCYLVNNNKCKNKVHKTYKLMKQNKIFRRRHSLIPVQVNCGEHTKQAILKNLENNLVLLYI